MSELLLDAARRRSPATLPEFHAGRPPRNKGMRCPADPPTIEEIVTVMRRAGDARARAPAARPDRRALARRPAHPRGARARRGRPGPAPRFTAVAARQGRPAPRGRDGRLGLGATRALAPGPGSCRSVRCSASSTAPRAGGRGRPPPRARSCAASPAGRRAATLRATPTAARPRRRDGREGVPLIVIQRQLGHTNLGITSIYLQGIDNSEIIDTVHARRAPMVPVHSSLQV